MEINDRLLDVLRYELEKVGLQTTPPVLDEVLLVVKGDTPVAYVQEDGFIIYSTLCNKEDALPIPTIVNQVWEMERAYQEAPVMHIDSVSKYRKLIEYNGIVLAARYDGEGLFTFASWQYTYDNNAVSFGHYFHENHYAAAKADFLYRSGLADRSILFQLDELAVIRDTLLFRGMQDSALQLKEQESLDNLLHRVDSMLTPSNEPLLVAEIEMEQES
ncbi:hypothetical protein BSK59_19845 [Paenibacillus odorifer]|uniref:hypothetical protein n=1 Tax=Paenibacillus odorifer TaxID=189426 RepID=UPI00096EC43E|nr:hypothetical protein [Paenibacillus odorifer]OME51778.1 hypothetical protein BSK59_19845 [Paenibacillus odorifer]